MTPSYWQQPGCEEWALADTVISPDYWIVLFASVQDTNWDDDTNEHVKYGGKDEEYKEDIFGLYIVLYLIENADKKNLQKNIANHHSKVVGEFVKSENIPPLLSSNAGMASIAGTEESDEGLDSSDEISIETTKCHGEGNDDESGLDVNI